MLSFIPIQARFTIFAILYGAVHVLLLVPYSRVVRRISCIFPLSSLGSISCAPRFLDSWLLCSLDEGPPQTRLALNILHDLHDNPCEL